VSTANVDPDFAAGAREPVAPDVRRRVSVAEGYECWAPTYDDSPNPLLAREERHLAPLLSKARNKSALDLACGTGRWLERLMVQGCVSGIGIDSSVAMLRVAGKKKAIKGRLTRANCESLPLPSAAFDLALCSFAVGHIRDLGSVVRELGRVTKTGADVFVSDLHPEAYAQGWRVGFRDGDGTAIQIETCPRAAEEIVHVFCSNGFRCQMYEALRLGEPEKPFFEHGGKSHRFVEASKLPAVLVCHFRRIGSPDRSRAE
jgi:ubiquinone/menaquinone biosynthesis C-methylase UbiE